MSANWKQYLIHLSLFIVTLITTTLAGAEWIGINQGTLLRNITQGLWYSLPFLGILTIHEFGHYIAARLYKVAVTLPYYLPFYFPGMPGIGTLGAFIRIKSLLHSRKMVFDVGIAGPLAGFIGAVLLLIYGFTHLPEPSYIYKVHKEYQQYGLEYSKYVYSYDYLRADDSLSAVKRQARFEPQQTYIVFATGSNLLFKFFESFVSNPAYIPNKYELFHYPFLFAGFLALFFTALNLIPIGQLDGGHILYGLIGSDKHRMVTPVFFAAFVFLGFIEFLKESFDFHPMESFNDLVIFAPFYILFLTTLFSKVFIKLINNLLLAVVVFATQYFTLYFFPEFRGFEGWWLFALLIGRFLGIYHPPALDDKPLDTSRKILGWLSFVIFIICFSPAPLVIETIHR